MRIIFYGVQLFITVSLLRTLRFPGSKTCDRLMSYVRLYDLCIRLFLVTDNASDKLVPAVYARSLRIPRLAFCIPRSVLMITAFRIPFVR
jgi:hypothetical protein